MDKNELEKFQAFQKDAMSQQAAAPQPKQESYSHNRYNRLMNETFDQIRKLSELKGGEYAGDNDRLANFRRNAVRLGLSMEQVWAVYVNKHIDAVMQYIQDIAYGKFRDRMEPLEGRVDDIIVYMLLFKLMLDERAEGEISKPNPNWDFSDARTAQKVNPPL